MPKLCIEKATILQTFNFHFSDITCCDFDDNFCLASGSSDKRVVVSKWTPGKGFAETSYSPVSKYKYAVTKVKFLSEEQELIASSADGSISILNAEDGEILHNLMHLNLASVRTFCYISESKYLISAGDDGSICIWDLPRRTLKKSSQIHDETISVICSSPDSKIVLTGDITGFVKLWHISKFCDTETNLFTPEHCIPDCHDLSINQAEFSPITDISDIGKEYTLVTCGNDNLIKLWKITIQKQNDTFVRCYSKLLLTMIGHSSAVTDVRFNFLGTVIASTSIDKTARLWTVTNYNYRCIKVLKGHKRYVTTCCFSRDGLLLATGSNDKSIIVWDLTGERSIHSHLHKNNYLSISNSPSSPYKQKNVSKVLQKIENLGNAINSCSFSRNELLAAGGTDKLVRLWHRSSDGKFIEISVSPLNGHQYAVTQVDFSLCGTYLASCSVDGTTIVWNLSEYKQIGTVHNIEGSVKCCKFSPDSRLLATAGDNEMVCVWNFSNLQIKANMTGHTDAVSCLSFTYDSKYLASGCLGGSIRLWCVTPCTTICMLCKDNVHDLGIMSMDFCFADKILNKKEEYLLATGGNDTLIKLWRLQIVDELTAKISLSQTLIGHGGDVTCVRFPPKLSNLVASAATDKTARIWNTNTGECLRVLNSKESMLTSCAFSFDGSLIATGTLDKAIIIWDLRENDEYETLDVHRVNLNHDNSITGDNTNINESINKVGELFRTLGTQIDFNSFEVPHEFICPITHQLIAEPVTCADGYTYEKAAIESWFASGKSTSPMTNERVTVTKLISNISLKQKINDFVTDYKKN